MSRTVLVLVSNDGGAMHRDVAELVRAIARDDRVVALVPRAQRERFAAAGADARVWRPGGFFGMGDAVRTLRRTALAAEPDVVHAHGFPAAAVALGTFPPRLARRTLVTFHDPLRGSELPRKLVDLRLPDYVRRAAGVVATYPALAAALEASFALDAGSIAVIPHAVDAVPFGPPLERPPLREGPLVGYRGRLDADRAWEVALDALASLRERLPDARLRIAGDGAARQFVRAQVRARKLTDAVDFVGDRPAADFFATIDVLVQPISRDAQPQSALEALVWGVPLVAANVGALRDAVEPMATGWLVPDDAAGFAEGVTDAWSRIDDAWRGAIAQRRAALERYARETAVAAYAERYASVATAAAAS